MAQQFSALWVEEVEKKHFTRKIVSRSLEELPAGDLLIKVHFSSLNYKDALSATGGRGSRENIPTPPESTPRAKWSLRERRLRPRRRRSSSPASISAWTPQAASGSTSGYPPPGR